MTETNTADAELLTDVKRARGDLRMLQSAIRKGWAIPDHVYEKAGVVIAQILAKGSNREKVAAARVLIAMNEQNNPSPVLVAHQHIHQVATEETALEQKRRELSGRIARLR
jgi:hypothetical protein